MNRPFGSANSSPTEWCLLAAIVIHALLLWQFRFALRIDLKNFSSSVIAVLQPSPEFGTPGQDNRQGTAPSRAASLGRERSAPSRQSPPGFQNESSPGAGGGSETGLGNVLSDSGGIGLGGVGTPSGGAAAGGTGSGSGSASGSGTETAQGKPGAATGRGPPSAASRAVVIPPSIQRQTSPMKARFTSRSTFIRFSVPISV